MMELRRKIDRVLSNLPLILLVSINILLLLAAVLIIGSSSYVYENFADFDEAVSRDSLIYIICAGLILFIFAISGLFGAIQNNKLVLKIYLVILLLLISGQVVGAFLILDYAGVLSTVDDYSASSSNASEFTSNSRKTDITNYLLRTYQTCCVGDEDYCGNLVEQENYCLPVPTCEEDSSSACFDGNPDRLQQDVDASICTTFKRLDLVGDSIDGECGGGVPLIYLEEVVDLITSNLDILGYAGIGLCSAQLLLVFFVVYQIFGKQNSSSSSSSSDDNIAVAVVAPERTSIGMSVAAVSNLAERNRLSQRLSVPAQPGNRNRSTGNLSVSASPRNRRGSNDSLLSRNRLSLNGMPKPANGKPARPVSVARSSIPRRRLEEDPEVINDVL